MNTLDTVFYLAPGFLSVSRTKHLLQLIFDDFKWLTPMRYGTLHGDKKLPMCQSVTDFFTDYYDSEQRLAVEGKPRPSFILFLPDRRNNRSYYGKLYWSVPVSKGNNKKWRENHIEQVITVMKLINAPLVLSGRDSDLDRKFTQEIESPSGGTTERPTIRGYNQGLAGLFWRNFYGPPFSQMFGERLKNLPQDVGQDLGDNYWLVEPYALPTDIETDAGRNKEKELIKLLNPECFYDFETNTLPTIRPDLPELEQDEEY